MANWREITGSVITLLVGAPASAQNAQRPAPVIRPPPTRDAGTQSDASAATQAGAVRDWEGRMCGRGQTPPTPPAGKEWFCDGVPGSRAGARWHLRNVERTRVHKKQTP